MFGKSKQILYLIHMNAQCITRLIETAETQQLMINDLQERLNKLEKQVYRTGWNKE